MNRLTAIILTKNEAENITDCITELGFTDDILVFDSYSTDNTIQLAQDAGARTIQHAFENYASQRNEALNSVEGQTDWVFFVDADERVPPSLGDEIRYAIQNQEYAAWQVSRHNYIFGKLTLGAGWYPDYQTRVLRVGAACYDPLRTVHEIVELDGPLGTLNTPLVHNNYNDIAQFRQKQRRYAEFEAGILFDEGTRPKLRNYILQPYRQFKRRYFTLKGYSDGWHGLRLSVLLAWYELRKYLSLRDLWRDHDLAQSTG